MTKTQAIIAADEFAATYGGMDDMAGTYTVYSAVNVDTNEFTGRDGDRIGDFWVEANPFLVSNGGPESIADELDLTALHDFTI